MKKVLQFTIATICILGIFVNSFGQCGVPAPNVTSSIEICTYDATPELSATIGDTWINGTRPTPVLPVEFRYYDVDFIALPPLAENTTGLYTPDIDKSTARTYTFYVAEYNPNALPQACEGPRTAVTITVKKVLPPILSGGQDVCAPPEGVNPTIVAGDYSGVVEWFESLPPTPATTGSLSTGANYQATFMAVGSHTVWAVQRLNGCVSNPESKSYTIKAIPPAPIAIPASICIGEVNKSVCATGTEIRWYQNANRTGLLVQNSACYLPIVTGDNTYIYHATQKVNGCESATAPVTYTINPMPTMPIVNTMSPVICDYNADPTFVVTGMQGASFKWYGSDQWTVIQNGGNSYSANRNNGTNYYVSQVVNGCEGSKNIAKFVINPRPSNPLTTDAVICEGDTVIPALRTNMSIDNWYSNIGVSIADFIQKGYNYSPDKSFVTNSDVTFYVQRDIKGCLSDIMPVTLHVLPKPTMQIGNDVSTCFSDVTVSANSLNPAYSNLSSFEWRIRKDNKEIASFTEQTIVPFTKISESGNYIISARYKYLSQNITCASDIDSINFTVQLCYTKEYLLFLLDSSINLISNAQEELKAYKIYKAGAIATFQTAINTAQVVYDKANATQSEIDNASIQLEQAITIFLSQETEVETVSSNIQIYPNVIQDSFTILGLQNEATITIFDIVGKQMLQQKIQPKQQIDCSNLVSGIYIVKVLDAKGIAELQLIKK